MYKRLAGLVLISSAILLGGCYESVDVSLHKPGEYKGEKDPLLTKMKSRELTEQLDQRFKQGQSDR